MGSFSSPKPPKPQPLPEPPAGERAPDEELDDVARRARLVAARAQGRSSTLITGGTGVTATPIVGTKQLLGQ